LSDKQLDQVIIQKALAYKVDCES